ncbi:thiamine pyrophosphate-dependent enzyme [Silvibacterium sp.]|uniref:thiamine pyrophosphate-dependent enzyme n=1 Tax=Silvibacterium sp. TaxID=1964179 RepID=UPI0039E65A57
MDCSLSFQLPCSANSYQQWPADPRGCSPLGIAACLIRSHEKTLSISGDGRFLFFSMELETAVRLIESCSHGVDRW